MVHKPSERDTRCFYCGCDSYLSDKLPNAIIEESNTPIGNAVGRPAYKCKKGILKYKLSLYLFLQFVNTQYLHDQNKEHNKKVAKKV